MCCDRIEVAIPKQSEYGLSIRVSRVDGGQDRYSLITLPLRVVIPESTEQKTCRAGVGVPFLHAGSVAELGEPLEQADKSFALVPVERTECREDTGGLLGRCCRRGGSRELRRGGVAGAMTRKDEVRNWRLAHVAWAVPSCVGSVLMDTGDEELHS